MKQKAKGFNLRPITDGMQTPQKKGRDPRSGSSPKHPAADQATQNSAAILIEWARKLGEGVRLTTQQHIGETRVDLLRIYFRAGQVDVRSTKRGVPPPHEQLAALREAVRKVEEALAAELARQVSCASQGTKRI